MEDSWPETFQLASRTSGADAGFEFDVGMRVENRGKPSADMFGETAHQGDDIRGWGNQPGRGGFIICRESQDPAGLEGWFQKLLSRNK